MTDLSRTFLFWSSNRQLQSLPPIAFSEERGSWVESDSKQCLIGGCPFQKYWKFTNSGRQHYYRTYIVFETHLWIYFAITTFLELLSLIWTIWYETLGLSGFLVITGQSWTPINCWVSINILGLIDPESARMGTSGNRVFIFCSWRYWGYMTCQTSRIQ